MGQSGCQRLPYKCSLHPRNDKNGLEIDLAVYNISMRRRGQYENVYPFPFSLSLCFFFFLWVEGDPEEWIKLATALGLLLVSRNTFLYIYSRRPSATPYVTQPLKTDTLAPKNLSVRVGAYYMYIHVYMVYAKGARCIQVSWTISGCDVSRRVQCGQMCAYYNINI